MGRVVVVGSINQDVVTTVARHPRPGETVSGRDLLYLPGGKGANQAVAAALTGAETAMVGKVGDDAFADGLVKFLEDKNVDCSQVSSEIGVASGTAIITVDESGENTIVVSPGANARLLDASKVKLTGDEAVVAQFEIPMPTIVALFERAHAAGCVTVLNPSPAADVADSLLDVTTVLVLNEHELSVLSGAAIDSDSTVDDIALAAKAMIARGTQVVVTLGSRGVLGLNGGEPIFVEGRPVDVVDTTGAGDCFTGALAAQLAGGATLANAMKYANCAASLSVQKSGASPSMPTAAEVVAEL